MKILHIINSLSTGGAEKLVADLAPLQRDCGNVSLFPAKYFPADSVHADQAGRRSIIGIVPGLPMFLNGSRRR